MSRLRPVRKSFSGGGASVFFNGRPEFVHLVLAQAQVVRQVGVDVLGVFAQIVMPTHDGNGVELGDAGGGADAVFFDEGSAEQLDFLWFQTLSVQRRSAGLDEVVLAVVAVVSLGSFFVESAPHDILAFFALEKNAFFVWADFFDATSRTGQTNHLAQ